MDFTEFLIHFMFTLVLLLPVILIWKGFKTFVVTPTKKIAKVVKKLVIFQRTPNYSIPARNKKLTKEIINNYQKNYRKIKNLR